MKDRYRLTFPEFSHHSKRRTVHNRVAVLQMRSWFLQIAPACSGYGRVITANTQLTGFSPSGHNEQVTGGDETAPTPLAPLAVNALSGGLRGDGFAHLEWGRRNCCCNAAVPANQKRQGTKVFQKRFRLSSLLPVMSAEECCLSARAELPFGGSSILHRSASSSSRKTRAWGVRRHASGRKLRRGRFRPISTLGLRACRYKTAPGRSNWPNRDPIGELGGFNLYGFVRNNPVGRYDPHGFLDAGPGIVTTIRISLIIGGTGVGPTIGGGLAVGGGALLCVGAVCFISSVPSSPVLYPHSGARNAPPSSITRCVEEAKVETCRKTRDWVDPATGRRFCIFRCDYTEEVVTREGSGRDGCDAPNDRFFRTIPD
jgi:RHS repeat-associated protein